MTPELTPDSHKPDMRQQREQRQAGSTPSVDCSKFPAAGMAHFDDALGEKSDWWVWLASASASESGAGEGNRTLMASLEGWNSTIELHPHHVPTIIMAALALSIRLRIFSRP